MPRPCIDLLILNGLIDLLLVGTFLVAPLKHVDLPEVLQSMSQGHIRESIETLARSQIPYLKKANLTFTDDQYHQYLPLAFPNYGYARDPKRKIGSSIGYPKWG